MKWVVATIVVLSVLAGCSGGDDSDDEKETISQANPCATRGSTYIVQCSEVSGDCGALADSVVNIASDGTLGTSLKCDKYEEDGCTARGTNCDAPPSEGCSIETTYATTFAADGSSADSTSSFSVKCNDGSSCYSTYTCSFTRQ